MAKAMVFIDNAWLRCQMSQLANLYGQDNFRIDYGKLPRTITRIASERLGYQSCELVRTFCFDGRPENYSPLDDDIARNRLRFFQMLRAKFSYDVIMFPIDFHGRRLQGCHRDPDDEFRPKQCGVDVGLATKLLYLGAQQNAYDVAIVVAGDGGFVSALQHTRMMGKRIVIASARNSCNSKLSRATDDLGVRDCDVIWLDDNLIDIELRRDRHQLECQSPLHVGRRLIYTTYWPEDGGRFYCDPCRNAHRQNLSSSSPPLPPEGADGSSEEESYQSMAA